MNLGLVMVIIFCANLVGMEINDKITWWSRIASAVMCICAIALIHRVGVN